MSAPRRLICAFHDLAPHSRRACERFLGLLRAAQVGKAVLLVVPRWHGERPINEDGAFVRWLRARAAEGHEVCLHGWEHRAKRVPRDPLGGWLGRVYTAGEGEFYDVDRAAAEEMIRAGLAVLRQAGFAPRGFVAPAWLFRRPLLDALRAQGFAYTTSLGRIHLLRARRALRAPVLGFSSRSAWRRALSRRVVALGAALARRHPILRIAAHPADLDHPAMARALATVVREAARDRTAVTYGELVQASAPEIAVGETR